MITTQVQFQTAASSGNGNLRPMVNCQLVTVYIRSIGAVSSGAIQIEETDQENPTGFAAVGSPVNAGTSDGAVVAVHLAAGCYAWLRARISTAIVGGTVTITGIGGQ